MFNYSHILCNGPSHQQIRSGSVLRSLSPVNRLSRALPTSAVLSTDTTYAILFTNQGVKQVDSNYVRGLDPYPWIVVTLSTYGTGKS